MLMEEERALAAQLANWYTFVIFENGGERSVTEIKLHAQSRASWPEMKARLIAKLGIFIYVYVCVCEHM